MLWWHICPSKHPESKFARKFAKQMKTLLHAFQQIYITKIYPEKCFARYIKFPNSKYLRNQSYGNFSTSNSQINTVFNAMFVPRLKWQRNHALMLTSCIVSTMRFWILNFFTSFVKSLLQTATKSVRLFLSYSWSKTKRIIWFKLGDCCKIEQLTGILG